MLSSVRCGGCTVDENNYNWGEYEGMGCVCGGGGGMAGVVGKLV